MKTFILAAAFLTINSALISAASIPTSTTSSATEETTSLNSTKQEGFYTSTLDESGNRITHFTPMAEHMKSSSITTLAKRLPIGYGSATGCKTGNNVVESDIDNAYACLQTAVGTSGISLKNKGWVYCFSGEAVAFICPYDDNTINANYMTYAKNIVDQSCGVTGLGYDKNSGLNVGRTNKGDHFCTKDFTG